MLLNAKSLQRKATEQSVVLSIEEVTSQKEDVAIRFDVDAGIEKLDPIGRQIIVKQDKLNVDLIPSAFKKEDASSYSGTGKKSHKSGH